MASNCDPDPHHCVPSAVPIIIPPCTQMGCWDYVGYSRSMWTPAPPLPNPGLRSLGFNVLLCKLRGLERRTCKSSTMVLSVFVKERRGQEACLERRCLIHTHNHSYEGLCDSPYLSSWCLVAQKDSSFHTGFPVARFNHSS